MPHRFFAYVAIKAVLSRKTHSIIRNYTEYFWAENSIVFQNKMAQNMFFMPLFRHLSPNRSDIDFLLALFGPRHNTQKESFNIGNIIRFW